jgi:Ca2+-binding RTX toxin-like protein
LGADTLSGVDGDDTFRFATFPGTNTVERIDGGAGLNVVAGTGVNNVLDLSATELVVIAQIDGGAGNDTITGGGGVRGPRHRRRGCRHPSRAARATTP